jgi:positive regulator of sigma E activity
MGPSTMVYDNVIKMKSAIERGIKENVRVGAAELLYLFVELLAIQFLYPVVINLEPFTILLHVTPIVAAFKHSLMHYYAA